MTEAEWRRVFKVRCDSKQGRPISDDDRILIDRAFATDKKRYGAMDAEVFNATVPLRIVNA